MLAPSAHPASRRALRQRDGCAPLQPLGAPCAAAARRRGGGSRAPAGGSPAVALLTKDGPSLAVVGTTGAVGQEFLSVIAGRRFPYSRLTLLGSARSAGRKQVFEGVEYTIQELGKDSFAGVDIALFSAGGDVSRQYAPVAEAAGATVVDNSSAFRMVDGVPLVVPEVNASAMAGMVAGRGGIVANPNCSTIIALMAVTPLHRAVGVSRMVVSTYQELEQQTREVLAGQPVTKKIFKQQYAFNLFSHTTAIGENGYNEEEMKMVKETRKIWGTDDVAITATCVRVPVMRAHAESINLTLRAPLSEASALALLAAAPGVSLIDDRSANRFPTPLDASNRDDVYVGRLRADISQPPGLGLDLFVCGDQIRKGAALNAIQIAEVLIGAWPAAAAAGGAAKVAAHA